MMGSLPFKGQIDIGGTPLNKLSFRERAQLIGVVYQDWIPTFRVRVFDFVLMGRYPYTGWWGQYSRKDHEVTRSWLETQGIDHLAQRYLDEVSGGERQKIFLTRALCQDTPFLLLDEPGQSLDPKSKSELYDQLAALAAGDKCIICATHDWEAIANPQAQVWGMHEGKLVYQASGGKPQHLVMEEVYHYIPRH